LAEKYFFEKIISGGKLLSKFEVHVETIFKEDKVEN
jgi:hypothetical protein